MPTYVYRAVTRTGLIVRNKVESASKQNLIKSLKNNNLMPIAVQQVSYNTANRQKKQKKNVTDIQEIMKNVNTTQIGINKSKTLSTREKVNLYFARSEKITQRDLVVFTQNFYLLKKANFNNIHALNTIIQSTDNLSFRGILEDILAGVEAGENMYTTMEYYSNIFPYIYINMIKVGELSGSLTNSLQQAVRYLDETEAVNRRLKSILIPNIILFVLLIVMLLVGTLVAIPAIEGVFAALGTKETLPAITLWFKDFIYSAIDYWYIPVAVIAAIIVGIVFYVRTPKGKYNFHYFKYKAPVFRNINICIRLFKIYESNAIKLKKWNENTRCNRS